jgi:uncharacterized protein (DUF1778 family)
MMGELEHVMATVSQSDARIEFRLSSARKAEIERAAVVQNRSLTDFATEALTEAARKVLADQTQHEHVQLSNRDRDRFLAMLDADPTPNAALRAAARRHRRRVA